MSRTREDARYLKRKAVEEAEANGLIADSMEARIAIVRRIESGEITPAEGAAELRSLKRNAKRNGKTTRQAVWRNG